MASRQESSVRTAKESKIVDILNSLRKLDTEVTEPATFVAKPTTFVACRQRSHSKSSRKRWHEKC